MSVFQAADSRRSRSVWFRFATWFVTTILAIVVLAAPLGCFGAQAGGFNNAAAFTLEFDPPLLSMRPGETKTVRVKIILTGQPGIYPIRADVPNLTVSPASFNADFSTVGEVLQDLTVTAPASVSHGSYTLEVGDSFSVFDDVEVNVNDGSPDFQIRASKNEVTIPNNTNSEDIQFEVVSLNGFSGDVKITWVSDGDVSPFPGTNDFVGNVTPSQPFVFFRKMYRYAIHNDPIPLEMNATDIPFTKFRGVTITIKRRL